MNGTEFILATAAILFVAFMAGWFAHWLISRITRVTRNDMDDLDRMAQELHETEEQRDQAVTYMQQREAERTNKMTQTEAELRAAMDGLRDARSEAENLRAQIEKEHQGTRPPSASSAAPASLAAPWPPPGLRHSRSSRIIFGSRTAPAPSAR